MDAGAPARSAEAEEAAESVALCFACQEDQGLCRRHETSVLPQLAQPHWLLKLMGQSRPKAEKPKPESREAGKTRRRHEGRAKRRLERALAGEFTPVRPTRSVA